jgi:hypothetical protein
LVLFGPRGAGKTWLAEHAAQRAGASCVLLRLKGVTTAADLVGQVQHAVVHDSALVLNVKAHVSAGDAPALLASALGSLRRRLLALAPLDREARPVVIIDDACDSCSRTAAHSAETAAQLDSLLAQLGGWARDGVCHVNVTCSDPRLVFESRAEAALGRFVTLRACDMDDCEAVACLQAEYSARGIALDDERAMRVLDKVGRLSADLVPQCLCWTPHCQLQPLMRWCRTPRLSRPASAAHSSATLRRCGLGLAAWLSPGWRRVTHLLRHQAHPVAWEAVKSAGTIQALLDVGLLTTRWGWNGARSAQNRQGALWHPSA